MSESTSDWDDEDEPFEFDGDPLNRYDGEPPAPQLHAGAILVGRFYLLHQYNKGGQSENVWAAWNIQVRRFVVLKFVRSLDEARRAAEVRGAVIETYEYNESIPENPFIVMEFAVGGPVDRLAAAWRADPKLLVRKFLPVIRAIADAHATGTVHRDLKPGNLLLAAKPPRVPDDVPVPELPNPDAVPPWQFEIKVADWGLAADAGDGESGYGGTPGFAAPEQWKQAATPAADVFGLAATLYYLLTGDHVMPPTTEFAHALQDGTRAYVPPAAVGGRHAALDRRLVRIIRVCLSAEPRDRFTAAALADQLERWLTGFPVRGDGGARQAALWVGRHYVLVAFAVLALAAVGQSVAATLADSRSRADAADAARDAAVAREEAAQSAAAFARAQAIAAKITIEHEKAMGAAARDLAEAVITQAELMGKFQAQLDGGWKLFAQARHHLSAMAAAAADDPSRSGEAAELHRRCGRLAFKLDKLTDAANDYDSARRLAEAAFKAQDTPANRHRLAMILREWGVTRATQWKLAQATAAWDQAVTLLVPVVAAKPEYRFTRAQLHMVCGNAASSAQEKLKQFGEAEKLLTALLAERPGDVNYRFTLAEVLNNRAIFVQYTSDESEPDCRRAVEIRRKLVEEQPDRPEQQAYLAASLNHHGNAIRKRRGPNWGVEAKAAYQKARTIYLWLVPAFPGVKSNRDELKDVEENLRRLDAELSATRSP